MRRSSLVLTASVATVFHTMLVFSVFLLFAGHNAPGGGFVGGLVAGAAFVLRYAESGAAAVQQLIRVPARVLFGLGLAVAVASGLLGFIGGSFLESGIFSAQLPVLGQVKTTSSVVFDVGVYLVVIGLVVAVLESLGTVEDEGSDQP